MEKRTANLVQANNSRKSFIKTAAVVSAGLMIAPGQTIARIDNRSVLHAHKLKDSLPGIRKIKDIIIYEDLMFYSSFPSIIKRPDGELLLAFRRAPDRKIFGEKRTDHVDPNSYLMGVRSKDGETWTKDPKLLYAHPFGGSQDPCLLQLSDGTLLCTSYGWAFIREDGFQNLKKPYMQADLGTFLGGYMIRSTDGGSTWQGPIYPPHLSSEVYYNAYGIPLPAYNRGASCEGKDGRIFWAVASHDRVGKTSVHLLISKDKGMTWEYSCPIAIDQKITFSETSLYETPKGGLVAFIRTAAFEDQACIARSTDGGKTFEKWMSMGFQGHPLNALRLPDERVLLTYGYRHRPFGIRACILNRECTDFSTASEIIIRDDGANGDLGYTWPVQLDERHVLVAYYFNRNNGTRHIAGTIVEIE